MKPRPKYCLLFCMGILGAILMQPQVFAQTPTIPPTKSKTATTQNKPIAAKATFISKLKFFMLKDSTLEYWHCIAGPQEMADRFTNVSLDSSGYFYGETSYPNHTFMLVNNKWEKVEHHNPLFRIGYDPSTRSTNIYGNSWKIISAREGGEWYYTKYIGDNWRYVTYPRDVDRDSEIIPICDMEGNLYMLAPEMYSPGCKLFKYENEQWTELGKVFPDRLVNGEDRVTFLGGQHGAYIVVVGNTLFCIKNYIAADRSAYTTKITYTTKVFEYTGGKWKSKTMEVAKIPRNFKTPTTLDRFETYWARSCYRYNGHRTSFVSFYLFRENDKLGLQDNEGHVVAEPVFDEICIKETPESILPRNGLGEIVDSTAMYCYEMIQGKDTIYVKVSSYLSSQSTLDGFGSQPGGVCGHCNGLGYTPERVEKRKIRGEWVKEQTITSNSLSTTETHYDISSGERRTFTKTPSPSTTVIAPGYYKEEIKTVVIPKQDCPYCNRHPVEINREVFEYDAANNVYVRRWR